MGPLASRWSVALAASLAAALLGGCAHGVGPVASDAGADGAPSEPCFLGFLGSASEEPKLTLTALGPSNVATPLVAGGAAPLVTPPQGGLVIFAGVRATNLSACAVTVTGSIRDALSGQLRVDTRTVNLKPQPDGWGTSTDGDISTFANIPACPNLWSTQDVSGKPYALTVTVTDPARRSATETVEVTPTCVEPAMMGNCACLCQVGYVLGEQCPP